MEAHCGARNTKQGRINEGHDEGIDAILAHRLFMNYLKVRCFFLVDKIGLCWGVLFHIYI